MIFCKPRDEQWIAAMELKHSDRLRDAIREGNWELLYDLLQDLNDEIGFLKHMLRQVLEQTELACEETPLPEENKKLSPEGRDAARKP